MEKKKHSSRMVQSNFLSLSLLNISTKISNNGVQQQYQDKSLGSPQSSSLSELNPIKA